MIKKSVSILANESKIACIAIVFLLFCACSDNNPSLSPEDNRTAVSFVTNESTTRASQIVTTENISEMSIFSSVNEGSFDESTSTFNFMYKQAANKVNGVWTYTPLKFWFNSPYTTSFFAVSPIPTTENGITVLKGETDAGCPSFTITPPTSPAQQADFCVATPVLNATYTDPDGDGNEANDTDGSVPFNFKHTTAKIIFKARYNSSTGDDKKAWIESIEMVGVKGSGNLQLTTIGTPTWTTDVSSSVTYTLTSLKDELIHSPLLKVGASGDDIVSSTIGTLCLIPQTIPSGAKLNVKIKAGGLINDIEGTDIYSFSVPISGTWNAGDSHTYSFIINDIDNKMVNSNSIYRKNDTWDISYTGKSKNFVVPVNGKYKIEIWGNQGGNTGRLGGKGGYTAGNIELTAGDEFKIYVGQCNYSEKHIEGWNGGGRGGAYYSSPGAGSIDVRVLHLGGKHDFDIVDIATDSDPFIGLTGNEATDPRIIVGGGGGGQGANDLSYYRIGNGGYGGGLNGGDSTWESDGREGGKGGTQTQGGAAYPTNSPYNAGLTDGSAGRGGNTGKKGSDGSSSGGGGGGWWGGGAGTWYSRYTGSGGGGGSSHVHSKLFTDIVYKAGNEDFLAPDGITTETGHTGAGLVRITLLEITK